MCSRPVALDQPVERIVEIIGRGIDLLVGVENGLQPRIGDARDVSDRIIDIAEVLHRRGIVKDLRCEPVQADRPRGVEIGEPERLGS